MEAKKIIVSTAAISIVLLGFIGCGLAYRSLDQSFQMQVDAANKDTQSIKLQLATMQGELNGIKAMIHQPIDIRRDPFPTHQFNSVLPAAPDSVEGKLLSEGKHWIQVEGNISVGSYVEDILKSRLDQPQGRGRIGKVVSLGADPQGTPGATVDFGRGYTVGINLSELAPISFLPEAKP